MNMPKRVLGDSASAPNIKEMIENPDGVSVEPLSLSAQAVYGGFHRLAWAVALSWLVFACCRGYGGMGQIATIYRHLICQHNFIIWQ